VKLTLEVQQTFHRPNYNQQTQFHSEQPRSRCQWPVLKEGILELLFRKSPMPVISFLSFLVASNSSPMVVTLRQGSKASGECAELAEWSNDLFFRTGLIRLFGYAVPI
jgi:hypothetical protein